MFDPTRTVARTTPVTAPGYISTGTVPVIIPDCATPATAVTTPFLTTLRTFSETRYTAALPPLVTVEIVFVPLSKNPRVVEKVTGTPSGIAVPRESKIAATTSELSRFAVPQIFFSDNDKFIDAGRTQMIGVLTSGADIVETVEE